MNEGWICPSCKRGVAPTEKTCDHGGQILQPMWTDWGRMPIGPAPEPLHVCACPPGTVCGNAACPMLPKITCGDLPSTMSG